MITRKIMRYTWRAGKDIDNNICQLRSDGDFIRSTLIPRTLAWFSIDDGGTSENNQKITLLNGYTAAAYTPPFIFFASNSLPIDAIKILENTGRCTLSAVTLNDPKSALLAVSKANSLSSTTTTNSKMFTCEELGLNSAKRKFDKYPCAVETSPIHMYCTLHQAVELDDDDDEQEQKMIILIVETFIVDGKVLSDPNESMKNRSITAKIDASLIQPIVSMGTIKDAMFYPMKEIRSMPRPKQQQDATSWTSDPFDTVVATGERTGNYETMEWNFRTDGRSCPLGFNPVTALIMPRPIGWISTYSATPAKVPHLAPYSFFIDVKHGQYPMVAFSAYRKGEGNDMKKDAHKDAEETGYFCFNLCNEELAVPMNYSAAELTREESEFKLAGLDIEPAETVDAPIVAKAPVTYECEYVRTVDVESFSIVIGKVKAISVNNDILSNDRTIDVNKLRPIARLGYMDEFSVF